MNEYTIEDTILKKYKLNPRTFNRIKKNFTGQKKVEWGQLKYMLTAQDLLRIQAAKLCPYSVDPKIIPIVYPHYRYLIYSLFIRPVDELVEDFLKNHLIKREAKFIAQFKSYVETVKSLFPADLQTCLKKNIPPARKHMGLWTYLVEYLDIAPLFKDPDRLSPLKEVLHDTELKNLVESFLVMTYERADILNILKRYTFVEWTDQMYEDYITFFFDLSLLAPTDWTPYLQSIPYLEAKQKDKLQNRPVNEVLIERGLLWHEQTQSFLKVAITKYMRVFKDNIQRESADNLKMAREAADMIIRLKNEYESLQDSGEEIAKMFTEFRIERESFGEEIDGLFE